MEGVYKKFVYMNFNTNYRPLLIKVTSRQITSDNLPEITAANAKGQVVSKSKFLIGKNEVEADEAAVI